MRVRQGPGPPFICWQPERGDYRQRNKVAELTGPTEKKYTHHQRERERERVGAEREAEKSNLRGR